MVSRVAVLLGLAFLSSLLVGCGKPARYGETYIGMPYDEFVVVNPELTAGNGRPDHAYNALSAGAALWERKGSLIKKLIRRGGTPTKVELPTGKTATVEPNGIVLVVAKI